MSLNISTVTHSDVRPGVPMASYTADGLWLWPQGMGVGPFLTMSLQDWRVIRAAMDGAANRFAAEFGED